MVDFVTVAERLGAFLEGTRVAELLALLCDLPAERLLSWVLLSATAFLRDWTATVWAILEPALFFDLAALDASFFSVTG